MLMSPRPVRFRRLCGSNPLPSSRMLSSRLTVPPMSAIFTELAPACFAIFCKLSWTMRYTATAARAGIGAGTFRVENRIAIRWRCSNVSQSSCNAVFSPRSFRIWGCNRCETSRRSLESSPIRTARRVEFFSGVLADCSRKFSVKCFRCPFEAVQRAGLCHRADPLQSVRPPAPVQKRDGT